MCTHMHMGGWVGTVIHPSSRVGVCRVLSTGMCAHASGGLYTVTHGYLLVPVCAYVYMHRNVQIKSLPVCSLLFFAASFFINLLMLSAARAPSTPSHH